MKQDLTYMTDLVRRASKEYEDNLEGQANFIQFFVTSRFGKHVQVFIYNFIEGRAGHIFHINLG